MAEYKDYKWYTKNQEIHFLNGLHFDILKKSKNQEQLSLTEKEFEKVSDIIYDKADKIANLEQQIKELKTVLLCFILTLITTYFVLIVLT